MSKVFHLNELEVPDLAHVPDQAIRIAMPAIVEVVADKARALAPQRSGRLRGQIEGKVLRGGLEGVVQASARHARMVHDGTIAHEITVRSQKVLRIPSGGHAYFRRSAHHPGTQGQPFLDDAADQTRDDVADILRDAGAQALGRAVS